MRRLGKLVLGIVIFVLIFGIGLAIDENINGGPWYTYVDQMGHRVILGEKITTSSSLEPKRNFRNPHQPFTDLEIKTYTIGDPYSEDQNLPAMIRTTNTIIAPISKIGHFVIDGFFK